MNYSPLKQTRRSLLVLLLPLAIAATHTSAVAGEPGEEEVSSLLPEPVYTLPSDTSFIGPKVAAAIRARQKPGNASASSVQGSEGTQTHVSDFTAYQPRTMRMLAARNLPIQFVGCLTVIDRRASSGLQLASECDVQNVQIGRH